MIARIATAIAFCIAPIASADVLNLGGTRNPDGSWTGLASLETVPVGNPDTTLVLTVAILALGCIGLQLRRRSKVSGCTALAHAMVAAILLMRPGSADADSYLNVGSGADGDWVVAAGQTANWGAATGAYSTSLGAATVIGQPQITVGDASGFAINDEVLLYVYRATGASGAAGQYETFTVRGVSGSSITLDHAPTAIYDPSQMVVTVQRVPNYQNVTINGTVAAAPWNGSNGGIVYFRARDTLSIAGAIDGRGKGFLGGTTAGASQPGHDGQSYFLDGRAGGGAGQPGWEIWIGGLTSTGGQLQGDPTFSHLFMGSGGGGGASAWQYSHGYYYGGTGGNGGAIVYAAAHTIAMSGSINVVGNGGRAGRDYANNGAGGSGGEVWLQCWDATGVTSTNINRSGGNDGWWDPNGGAGLARLDFHLGSLTYGGVDQLGHILALDGLTITGNETLASPELTVQAFVIDSGGTLTMHGGDHLTVNSGFHIASGGRLHGSGTLTGNLSNSGQFRIAGPGTAHAATGAFQVQGNFTQSSSGALHFDLGGYSQGIDYDFLHISGTANLAGSVSAALTSGFRPDNHSTFDLLTADGGISIGSSALSVSLPLGFSYALANNDTTLRLLYALSDERHYAGGYSGSWNSSSVWTDRFGDTRTGAPAPTADNPVFINRNAVGISLAGAHAKSVLVNGGKLVVDGTAGGSLQVAEHLELGNSLHTIPGDPTHTGTGQGHVQQVRGSHVTVNGDLILGGQDSVYEISDTSRLNVRGDLRLLDDTNALFHQRGGTVIIGSTFDTYGHSTDGLLDLGRGTTYEMDGGVLDVATIQQTGLFVFKGGQLYVRQMLINTTPDQPEPTYAPAPAPVYSPATPQAAEAASAGGGGGAAGGCHVTPGGGFTLERGIIVLDQYSDWRLQGENANLTIGANSDGGSNGNFVQAGGNVNVSGDLVIGNGPGGKGNYAMSAGALVVDGQMVLGRDGGIGYFDQTGGTVTINERIIITESTSGASHFNITGGTMQAMALSIGANGGPGELHIGADAVVRIIEEVTIGPYGKVTGSGTFDIEGADVTNQGLIQPGNSPGAITFNAAYTQTATGTLHMELAGATTAGVNYDLLTINGDLSLAGTLVLDFIGGYAPLAGDKYDLIVLGSGGQLLGDLGQLLVQVQGLRAGWQYDLDYDAGANHVYLRSLSDGESTVPEPASLSLLALGGVGLLRRRRRAAGGSVKRSKLVAALPALAIVALAGGTGSTAHAAESVSAVSFTGGSHGADIGLATFGFTFDVTEPVVVTHLAQYDFAGNGLAAAAVPVGLWDESGDLLASGTIAGGTDAPLMGGIWRTVAINPITLPVGTGYTVGAAVNAASGDYYALDVSDFATATGIVYTGNVHNVSIGDFGRPTLRSDGNTTGHFGGGFFIAIPEPASLSLLALAGIGLLRRRHRSPREACQSAH